MDRDLVEQARRGDREAFAVLVHQVSDTLYAVAQRILRDPGLAEDALQNALVLAWRRIPQLRDPDRFEAWIHRILVHACYDESQRARHWTANVRVLPIDGPIDSGRQRRHRRSRRTGAGLPPAHDRTAGGLRPAPLPRAAPRGDRRDARDPRGHGPIATALRHRRPPGGPDGRTRSPSSTEDASHDRRSLARTRRSIVHRGRPDPGA